MSAVPAPRIALLYPGDRAARDRSDPAVSRFAALFEAFAAAGLAAEPAVWHDDFADEVAAQLRRVQAVLVWCNPIEDGRRRDRLDAVLREVAQAGVFVSAHPEAIQRLGTKDVLFETRALPFGSGFTTAPKPSLRSALSAARAVSTKRQISSGQSSSGPTGSNSAIQELP